MNPRESSLLSMSNGVFKENSKTCLIQYVEGINFSRCNNFSNDLMTSKNKATEQSKICAFSFFEWFLKLANFANITFAHGAIETCFIHNTSVGSSILEISRVKQKNCTPESVSVGFNTYQRSYTRKILELPS